MTPKDLQQISSLAIEQARKSVIYFPVPVASFNRTSLPLMMAGINSSCAFVGNLILG
jgi:hypothetical protein